MCIAIHFKYFIYLFPLHKCKYEVTVPVQQNCAPCLMYKSTSKGKGHHVQALRLSTGRTAHRGSRGIDLPFLDHGARRGWGVSVTPRPLFTPGKTRYPLYRRLGGPQGRSGQVRKILPPPGLDPRTIQPIAQSLYRLSYRAHVWYICTCKLVSLPEEKTGTDVI